MNKFNKLKYLTLTYMILKFYFNKKKKFKNFLI